MYSSILDRRFRGAYLHYHNGITQKTTIFIIVAVKPLPNITSTRTKCIPKITEPIILVICLGGLQKGQKGEVEISVTRPAFAVLNTAVQNKISFCKYNMSNVQV